MQVRSGPCEYGSGHRQAIEEVWKIGRVFIVLIRHGCEGHDRLRVDLSNLALRRLPYGHGAHRLGQVTWELVDV